MKVIVELSDFYLDENEELLPALRKEVINQAVQHIKESIKARVESQVIMEVKESVERELYKTISAEIKANLEIGEIVDPQNGRERIKITEFIKRKFEKDSGWNSPNDYIAKIAKEHATELKQRYDLMFAAQIVQKMSEAGLLKEDIAKQLLAGDKTNG